MVETRLILAAGFAASIRHRHGSRDSLPAGREIATTVHQEDTPFRASGVSRAACRGTRSDQTSLAPKGPADSFARIVRSSTPLDC